MTKNSNRPRKIRLPRSLKSSPNSFSFFFKFLKNELKSEYPNLTPQERMKVAAARWHALSEEERNDYKKYAADDRTLKQRPIFGIGTSILSPGKDNNESSTILFSDRSASHDLSPEEKFFDYGKYYGN